MLEPITTTGSSQGGVLTPEAIRHAVSLLDNMGMESQNYLNPQIKVGDVERFENFIEKFGIVKTNVKRTSLYGVDIIETDTMPKDTAVLIGHYGEIVQIFKI